MNARIDNPGTCCRRSGRIGFLWLVAGLALSFVLGGCFTLTFGRRPDLRVLDQLVIGQSSKTDALRLLGPPGGGGRAQFPPEDRPRDLWYYYYEEGSLREDQREFLFLFFADGVFDGYMWFSSLPPLLAAGPAATPP